MGKKIVNNNKQNGSSKRSKTENSDNNPNTALITDARRQKGNGDKRSSKANSGKQLHRKKSSYSNNKFEDDLRKVIEADGTKSIIEMSADGNCLFRSLSDQLYYDYGNRHVEVRDDVVDYMEDHKDDFVVFLVLDDQDDSDNRDSGSANDNDATDFESYCHAMRQDGTWGGNLELVAASKVYRRNITVYSSSLAAFTIHYDGDSYSSGPDLLLSYHDNDHYNSIRMNNISKFPRPLPRSSSESSTKQRCSDASSLNSGSVTKQKNLKHKHVSNQVESTTSLYVEVLEKPEDEEISSTDTDSSGSKTVSTESDSSTATTAATSVGTLTSSSAYESSVSCSSSACSSNVSATSISVNDKKNRLGRSKSWNGEEIIEKLCKCTNGKTCRKCRKAGTSRLKLSPRNVSRTVSNDQEKGRKRMNYFGRKKSRSVERCLDSDDGDGDDEDNVREVIEGQFRIMKI